MASLDDINDVVAAFLVAAADALALTEGGVPARAYVSAGRPALDCPEQLTAWATFLGNVESIQDQIGLSGSKRQQSRAQPVLTIVVQATRCTPAERTAGGKAVAPSAEALAAVSRLTSQDVWALWNHINHELKQGALSRICAGAWRDGAQVVDGQGGAVGWEITYRYPIEGGYPFEMET